VTVTAPFDPERFERARRERGVRLGEPLHARAETRSTNDDAAEAARAGAPHGALFVADAQTRGRGRRGHTWMSPPCENLTFSLVLRPQVPPARVSALTLVVGAAVRAALDGRTPARPLVKWPNDVIVDRKKLAGILVESQLHGDSIAAVIVGIGVNVHMRSMPPEIESVATSLSLLGDPGPDREQVLAAILAELGPRLEGFERDGLGTVLEEVRRHDALLGVPVRVEAVRGRGAGIADDGSLLVEQGDGQVRAVASGTVEW
jgi:BirA family biotin operon repressor/biotin-[acetyl-CoA-carboxylase] ligase